MANPTVPFSWQMPTPTDLVTDLPADFEVFGQAVATSMQDLLGGTTGQVLAKASDTDMDFVWSADAAGMTNPMTTTADIIYSSSGSTPARLGIGTVGQVLQVNSGATAPEWADAGAADNYELINPGGTALTGASTITISGISGKNRLYIESTYWITTASGPSNIEIRLNTDSGSNYLYYGTAQTIGGTNVGFNGSGGSEWRVGRNSNANGYCAFAMNINGTNAAGYKTMQFSSFNLVNPSIAYTGTGRYSGTSTISSISIISSAGDFTGGTLFVYGA
jgi:hypothetical protein